MKREKIDTSQVLETRKLVHPLGSMAGRSSFSSVSESNSSRQFMIYRRQQDGVEVPLNSLDMPMKATSSHQDISENFMAKQTFSKTNFRRNVSPIKMMINEKIGDRENPKRGPGVVARLMGMDSLPTETRPAIHLKEHYEENPRKFISREPRFTGNKTESGSLSSNTLKQPKVESSLNHDNHYSNPSTKSLSSVKPLRREHPQEELLQKFKKDFEAWQASKAWGFSSNLDQNEIGQQQKDEHVLAMQNFDMEKRERFLSSERFQVQKKPKEIEAYASVNKQDGNLSEQCMPRTKDDVTMKKKLLASSLDPVSKSSFHEKISRSCSPARIVILKPTTDMKEEMNESWRGPSEVLGKGSSMEDFLEEVKERLRLEMEGKGRKESIKRGVGTHASLHERPADPKQLARDVAKHMRESARDFGAPMMRSESTKIYMDDFNLKEKEVFEAMKRETRKLIPHMMKNVVKDDYDDNNEKDKSNDQRVGNSLMQDDERTASNSVLSKVGKGASFWEDGKAANETIPKYVRELEKRGLLDTETMSPPNFIRSFSAPATGTDFRKLILEDRHLVMRSPGLRDDVASESDSAAFNKNKKDGFNIKGKVSNLTKSFSFKGKIFGKKAPSAWESNADIFNCVSPTETVPTVVRNLGELQDNPTEVPPSPASFSSSPINFHLGHASLVETPCVRGNSSQVTCELSISLPERINQPEKLGSKGTEEVATEAQLNNNGEVTSTEGHAESYVRNILEVSGLCKDWPLSNQVFSSLRGKTKPIDSWVFDEVEEKYRKHGKADDDKSGVSLNGINVGRKVMFDLASEALLSVLGVHMTQLLSKEMPPNTKLLDVVLHQMNMYAKPKVDQSLSVDKLLALDVKLAPSLTAFDEDNISIGEELELVIVGELIDELVPDLLF